MASPKIVVAGTVRGGTNYVRFALRDLGYDATHEALFNDETNYRPETAEREWEEYTGDIEVSGFAWRQYREIRQRGIPIVQLIRNPVDVVNSILHRWPHSYGSFTVPGTGFTETHELVAMYWYAVHSTLSLYASSIIMLEKIDIEFSSILFELGDGEKFEPGEIIKALCQDAKHRSFGNTTPKFEMHDLPKPVQDFAASFGYTT